MFNPVEVEIEEEGSRMFKSAAIASRFITVSRKARKIGVIVGVEKIVFRLDWLMCWWISRLLSSPKLNPLPVPKPHEPIQSICQYKAGEY